MRPDHGPHFLIATEAEAAAGADSIQLDGINAFAAWENGTHGLGASELAELQCLVTNRGSVESVLDEYEMVFARSEMHGPWLVKLPTEFVSALAKIDGESLRTVGDRWLDVSTDRFQFRKTPREWIQDLGEKLVRLANRANSEKKNMYWEPPSC